MTAVSTRLPPTEEAELVVQYESAEPQRLPLNGVAEFVTEEGNPGNERHVIEVEVWPGHLGGLYG